MFLSRRHFLGAVGFAAAGTLAGCGSRSPGAGLDLTVLRLALNQTRQHPSYVALTNWSDRLEERTDGRVRIDVFANEVLGAQQEILNLMSDRIVDLAIISGPQLENLNKDFQVFNLPRVFDSIDHQTRVVNDPAITGELFTSLEARNHLTVLGGFTQGARNLYTKRPVATPQDLRGVKIRVQESPVMLGMIRAMGGSPTPMAYGEVYTALQSGVLDGAENNEVSYFTQKHFEVAPLYTYTEHLVGLDYMVASTGTLQSLSAEVATILEQEWVTTYTEFNELWKTATEQDTAAAQAAGATFTRIDLAPFDRPLTAFSEGLLSSPVQQRLYDQTRAVAG